MEIEILKEKETPLLSRKRVTAQLNYSGATPSRVQIVHDIAKRLNVKPEHIVIRHIYTSFGSHNAKVIIHVYQDAAILERLEGLKMIAKHKPKEKKE